VTGTNLPIEPEPSRPVADEREERVAAALERVWFNRGEVSYRLAAEFIAAFADEGVRVHVGPCAWHALWDEFENALRDSFKNDVGKSWYMGHWWSGDAEEYVEGLLASARARYSVFARVRDAR
jgi:hypothetical protein